MDKPRLRLVFQAGRRIAAGALLALALCTAAYRYGMYFDVSFYRLELALIAAFLLLWAGSRVVRGQRIDGPAGFPSWWKAGPLVLAGLYAGRLAGEPVSVLGTVEQGLRWAAYGAFLLALSLLCRDRRIVPWLRLGLQAAGAFLLWGALAGWMGWIRFPEIVMVSGDARLSSMGARLAGFVQYPNMLGAAAAALLVWQLLLLAEGERRQTDNPGSPNRNPNIHRRTALFPEGVWLPAISAVPAGVVLLLTESRGAWLVAAAGWAAAVALAASRERRTRMLVHSGWTAAAAGIGTQAALAAVSRWEPEGGAGVTAAGTMIVLLVLAGAALVHVMLCLLLPRLEGRLSSLAAWVWCAAGAACLALFLPQALQGRIGGSYETASARHLFYLDALTLFREAPVLGYGGGAWRALFTSVQREPYVGSEVHSGYLDMLLNLGLIGLLVLLAALAGLLHAVWRRSRAAAVPAAMLLLHAAVDFDMAYGWYWLFLLAYAAVNEAAPRAERAAANTAPGTVPARRRPPRAAQMCAAILAAALLLAAAAAGWRLERAFAAREAAAAADTAPARVSGLRAALEANPAWTRIRLELAPLLQPEERRELLAAGLRYEPQSAPLLWELGRTAAELGQSAEAADYFGRAQRVDRFNAVKRTQAVAALAELAEREAAAGRQAEAREAAEAGLALYRHYTELDAAVRAMDNPANGRDFRLTDEALAAEASLRSVIGAER